MNTKDVTMSFIAVVIIFLKYLREIGINKLNVCMSMPIRQFGHRKSCERRIDYYFKNLPEKDFMLKKEELLKKEKIYNENVNIKLYRTFQRVLEQGDVLSLLSIPFQNRKGIEFKINDGIFYNDLAKELYDTLTKYDNDSFDIKNRY